MKNEFNFYNAKLVPKNGKFYFEAIRSKTKVYEVSEEQFKMLLVQLNSTQNICGTESTRKKLDYLLNQLEMTEDLFDALLYQDWIYKEEYKEETKWQ